MYTIYLVTNQINGKKYVGYTSYDINKRMSEHRSHAKLGSPYLFHQAIRKYGWDAFTVEILYVSKDEIHTRKTMEPYFIDEHKAFGFSTGYNMTSGGDGSPCTPEKRANISKALKTTYKGSAGQVGNSYGKDQLWFTDGTINIKVHKDSQPPEGFYRGRVFNKPFKPYKRNKPPHNKGKKLINDIWQEVT
jgi:group I intron endonuclease